MTSQKLNEEHEILRRFMAVVVSSAFRSSLNKAQNIRRKYSPSNFAEHFAGYFPKTRWTKIKHSAPNPLCTTSGSKLLQRKSFWRSQIVGQDYYQTYARTRVERMFLSTLFFCLKHRQISENGQKWHLFPFLRESQVARNSGDIPV